MPPNHPSAPAGPESHRTTTTERGSFCYAHCTCGWRGPSRRSRDKARTDASTHPPTTPDHRP
ncbi:hypothetical protein [Streptomyces candidus]|uniref:Uncharacterized protein n=1 Tax=Streptomyces candidus TaxID=67283 RepID=A0A7X0HDU0_9ACTN|nr:hypothetical protein [Streptomyces candidus]MBB6435774.1 hypothetical protein [Streptomyces candidus]